MTRCRHNNEWLYIVVPDTTFTYIHTEHHKYQHTQEHHKHKHIHPTQDTYKWSTYIDDKSIPTHNHIPWRNEYDKHKNRTHTQRYHNMRITLKDTHDKHYKETYIHTLQIWTFIIIIYYMSLNVADTIWKYWAVGMFSRLL